MVAFRLSCEEYEIYRAACPAAGVRSLSELARTAMHQLVAVRNGSPPVDDQLRELRQQVQVLSGEVQRIEQKLDGVAAVQHANNSGSRTNKFSLASH
ncbi:MAG: hypothetical protein ABSH47_25830 [Bryobacteraceae bacterium]|jgi:hypothetical protein